MFNQRNNNNLDNSVNSNNDTFKTLNNFVIKKVNVYTYQILIKKENYSKRFSEFEFKNLDDIFYNEQLNFFFLIDKEFKIFSLKNDVVLNLKLKSDSKIYDIIYYLKDDLLNLNVIFKNKFYLRTEKIDGNLVYEKVLKLNNFVIEKFCNDKYVYLFNSQNRYFIIDMYNFKENTDLYKNSIACRYLDNQFEINFRICDKRKIILFFDKKKWLIFKYFKEFSNKLNIFIIKQIDLLIDDILISENYIFLIFKRQYNQISILENLELQFKILFKTFINIEVNNNDNELYNIILNKMMILRDYSNDFNVKTFNFVDCDSDFNINN